MHRSVLITGASGLIGRGVSAALAGLQHQVVGVTRNTYAHLPSEVAYRSVDLLDAGQTRALLDDVRPTDLVACAWITTPGIYWESSENEAWVGATLELVKRFFERGGKRAVILGTCAEYDWSDGGVLNEANTPCRPATRYGNAKHLLHQRLQEELPSTDSWAWARIFGVYGPGEQRARLTAAVSLSLLAGKVVECSEGTQVRDYLFSADAGGALASLLLSDVTGAVNIGVGDGVPVRELITEIGKATGRADLLQLGARPMPVNEPPVLIPDVSRLRDEVGWRPSVSLDEGIRRTVEWWRGQLDSP